MKISIEIQDPPEGYDIPKRGPLFLPISCDTIVLIGECWVKAMHGVFEGGFYWIYANKKLPDNNGMHTDLADLPVNV